MSNNTLLLPCNDANSGPLRSVTFFQHRIEDTYLVRKKSDVAQLDFTSVDPVTKIHYIGHVNLLASPVRERAQFKSYFGHFFAAPENPNDLFFVSCCWAAHTNHQRIYILDTATYKPRGFLNVPGIVRSTAVRGRSIFVLFTEPRESSWCESGDVVYIPISEYYKCPYERPVYTLRSPNQGRIRVAGFDGIEVANLTPNR